MLDEEVCIQNYLETGSFGNHIEQEVSQQMSRCRLRPNGEGIFQSHLCQHCEKIQQAPHYSYGHGSFRQVGPWNAPVLALNIPSGILLKEKPNFDPA